MDSFKGKDEKLSEDSEFELCERGRLGKKSDARYFLGFIREILRVLNRLYFFFIRRKIDIFLLNKLISSIGSLSAQTLN